MTFTYKVIPEDWLGIAPLIVLTCMVLIVMLVDAALPHAGERSKHSGPANFVILPALAFLGSAGAIAATITLFLIDHPAHVFNNMIGADAGTLCAYLIILSAGALGILLSPAYLKRLKLVHQGEYYALLLLAIIGMMLMAASISFLIVFVGLEMFSLALYILCSFIAQRRTSQESGMKYFLLSSFASAFLLYGIALTYAATGSTSFVVIAQVLKNVTHAPLLLLVAMGLLSVGFAFKVSAIPFHAWTPDVYQGAPAPVTAFMSVGTKVAALLAFVRIFGFMLAPVHNDWLPVVWVLAVLTIVGGNVMAVVQTNMKRMLAYSSIAHAGYLLIGVVVEGSVSGNNAGLGASAILFYLSCYLFMNLGAFGVISVLERLDNKGSDLSDLRGLWYRRPALAGFLGFFLFSLAGFPPMAGFAAKYYIFYAALVSGHFELLIIGILASLLGIYYYLRFIATMFMERRESLPALPVVPAITVPTTPVRGVTRTPSRNLARAATAVADRPVAARVASVALPAEAEKEEERSGELLWISWTGLGIAALGTLTVGSILAAWLPNLQQAAQLLLK